MMIIALLAGKEGARNIMMFFAALGLLATGLAMLQNWELLSSAWVPGLAKAIFLAVLGFGFFTNGWCLWALSRPQVQHYLYLRSLPEGLRDE